ncbi:hypothetical protein HOY80DRAFT_1026784 [Tuber brumale]|nr:hypothetical protein HOY80DRAFT_1026784 [Tuber brumale]
MTGFQKYQMSSQKGLIDLVEKSLQNGNKILFLQKTLTGALDSYMDFSGKYQVTMTTQLRKFRTVFDTKRIVTNNISVSASKIPLLDTNPYLNISHAQLDLQLMNTLRQKVYSNEFTNNIIYSSKSSKEELLKYFVRLINFISMEPGDLNYRENIKYFDKVLEFFEKMDITTLLPPPPPLPPAPPATPPLPPAPPATPRTIVEITLEELSEKAHTIKKGKVDFKVIVLPKLPLNYFPKLIPKVAPIALPYVIYLERPSFDIDYFLI